MGLGRVKEKVCQCSEDIAMAYEDPGPAAPRIHKLVCPASCGTMAQVVPLLCWHVWKEYNAAERSTQTAHI